MAQRHENQQINKLLILAELWRETAANDSDPRLLCARDLEQLIKSDDFELAGFVADRYLNPLGQSDQQAITLMIGATVQMRGELDDMFAQMVERLRLFGGYSESIEAEQEESARARPLISDWNGAWLYRETAKGYWRLCYLEGVAILAKWIAGGKGLASSYVEKGEWRRPTESERLMAADDPMGRLLRARENPEGRD